MSEQVAQDVKNLNASPEAVKSILQAVNTADIDLRASLPSTSIESTQPSAPLVVLVEQLFAPTARVRGTAYDEIMAHYASSPDLVPALLKYAENHTDNFNGIYNTLVVLSHLDLKSLGADLPAIRASAESVRKNGEKTSDRVDKLIWRLSH